MIVDRTGLVLSDASHATTRMRKLDDETIEAQMTIEDDKALTKPWQVTKRYKKQPRARGRGTTRAARTTAIP